LGGNWFGLWKNNNGQGNVAKSMDMVVD